jgi:membrane-associated phospholipid phosphatase
VPLALGSLLVALGLAGRDGRLPDWDTDLAGAVRGPHLAWLGRLTGGWLLAYGYLASELAVLFVVVLAARRGRTADAAFLGLGGAALLSLSLLAKEQFARPGVKYSYPSGHAAASAFFAVAVVRAASSTRWRRPLAAAGTLAVVVYGGALVHADWHLPSDIVGGWCLALGTATVTDLALRLRRRARGGKP